MPGTTVVPGRPRSRPPTEYAQLLATVQEMGLMRRRYGYYTVKIGVILLALASLVAGFVLVGNSWLQLLVAAGLAIVLTHIAFLSHDAAHRQILLSGKANDRLAVVVANLGVGISVAWWTKKHTKHHAAPNQIGKDPDIEPSVLHFYPPEHRSKNSVLRFFSARQGWWFFPILAFEGLNLHAQSLIALLSRKPVKNRWSELSLVTVRLTLYVGALLLFLPLSKAAAFLGLQMAVFGIYMGCTFAPNHKGMPIVPAGSRIDFFSRQVLMSRNITGTRFMTFAMGGLNYQIEHHLFPSMPRPNLRHAQPAVRDFCAVQQVPYTETSLPRSYGIVVRYLNEVGLGARDPFQCPLVASYRPRG